MQIYHFLVFGNCIRYGYWGVCFIYATFNSLRALSSTGKTYDNNEAVRKGVKFLLSIQNEEGGWGESHKSCPTEVTKCFTITETIKICNC